jgi:hypothetical protein
MALMESIQQWQSRQTSDLTNSYKSKGFKASGNWPSELQWVNTISPFRINIKLLGASYTEFMMNGRGPTSPTAPFQKGEPLIDIIKRWISNKKLDLNPYAVTNTIHAKGTKQFRNPDPKKKNLITDAITDEDVDDLISLIQRDQVNRIITNITKTFK